MITIQEANDILDEIANSLPAEFYKYLNAGIILQPQVKPHPESKAEDLFIMGEYCHDSLGRYIIIYYGSFIRVHGHLGRKAAAAELRAILLHEFTHHLESLSGERDLEIKDARDMAEYRRGHNSS
ncbi:MAG: metallopeptidase family protein [Clostridiales bacterium]|nr:metallopeptidase family protein [Clostridiales bacterium]